MAEAMPKCETKKTEINDCDASTYVAFVDHFVLKVR